MSRPAVYHEPMIHVGGQITQELSERVDKACSLPLGFKSKTQFIAWALQRAVEDAEWLHDADKQRREVNRKRDIALLES